jgi:hypothetical protein
MAKSRMAESGPGGRAVSGAEISTPLMDDVDGIMKAVLGWDRLIRLLALTRPFTANIQNGHPARKMVANPVVAQRARVAGHPTAGGQKSCSL